MLVKVRETGKTTQLYLTRDSGDDERVSPIYETLTTHLNNYHSSEYSKNIKEVGTVEDLQAIQYLIERICHAVGDLENLINVEHPLPDSRTWVERSKSNLPIYN
jgi:hypothetical protein